MAYTRIPAAGLITKEFTSSGTWTCPGGVYSAEFLVVGAGGAGGGSACSVNTKSAAGGGGGGGAVKKQTLPVTPGTTYTITVGAKGSGVSQAAGGNGGFSEVLNGATTLIRAFGGMGGQGATSADAVSNPTASASIAGGGGLVAQSTGDVGGGGGGGSWRISDPSATATDVTSFFTEGRGGNAANNSSSTRVNTLGGIGLDGFGNGGGGGGGSGATTVYYSVTPYGAGAGATRITAGATSGSAATIAGCGGGGSVTYLATTAATGGNGADGIVRITYFG